MAPRLARWQPADWPVADDWCDLTRGFFDSVAGQGLAGFITERLAQGATIYPPQPLRALELTPLAQVRVVILGQDPYHGPGQAEGLAFSVRPGMPAPPSLRNIQKELRRDLGGVPATNSLAGWARQGVLLLNACLSVEEAQANSHAGRGWELLTGQLLAEVARRAPHCAYLLWGAQAQKKAELIAREGTASGQQQLILHANHPSPLSALRPPLPFIGCGHFSATARWLAQHGQTVDWLASYNLRMPLPDWMT